MNLEERINLLEKLGKYFLDENNETLYKVKVKAFEKNKWFTVEFIDVAIKNIANEFLQKEKLKSWVQHYCIDENVDAVQVGIVMAGNIPLVGFHDFLCVFIMGHQASIKVSEKDDILIRHVVEKLGEWNAKVKGRIQFKDLLKDCAAYIATGSNNSSRYFNYYFGKYPSIIRKNKTSMAILSGKETPEELCLLADDVQLFFGLGCRNVTKILVPENYDFVPLLDAFRKYHYFIDHSKYKNNYDYNLTLLIMNNKYYMTNESLILVEKENLFSPVSQLNYSFYKGSVSIDENIKDNIQCIVGERYLPFGQSQTPGLFDYADGVDTIQFLLSL